LSLEERTHAHENMSSSPAKKKKKMVGKQHLSKKKGRGGGEMLTPSNMGGGGRRVGGANMRAFVGRKKTTGTSGQAAGMNLWLKELQN